MKFNYSLLSFTASTSFYTDDELKIKSLPRVNNATYDKQSRASSRNSVLSVSSIAMKLGMYFSFKKKTKIITKPNLFKIHLYIF